MRPRRVSVILAVVTWGALVLPAPGAGQEGCEFVPPGNDLVRNLVVGGLRITYITNPHFLCSGGVEIFADSAEAFPDRGYSHLIGNVRYVESLRELTADDARYFTNEGRLQAQGNVRVVDEEQGSSIEHGDLVYLLETDFRDVAEMTVTTGADGIRPVAVLTPAPVSEVDDAGAAETVVDSVAPPVLAEPRPDTTDSDEPAEPTPYRVVGDRIFLLGTGYFTASGDVEIDQDSLRAFADSAEYDSEGSGLVLDGHARVLSAGYDLVGRSITMSAPGAVNSRIHALREARLEGEDLLLTSAQIFLFLEDDALERLVATPIVGRAATNADSVDRQRPRAIVEDFILTADSLEVLAPEQRVQRVFASGSARSESSAGDSLTVDLLPEVARTDWLEGDTVIVNFTATGPAPSATAGTRDGGRLEVEDIVAVGRAKSLYRLAPNDSLARPGVDPPAVHYVVGTRIRIEMQGRQVHGMQVTGQTQGVHLEPLQRRPPPDTTAVRDSLGVVDTTAAVSDTGAARPRPPSGASAPRVSEHEPLARVRLSSPSQPNRPPDGRTPLRMANHPWNRPWIR